MRSGGDLAGERFKRGELLIGGCAGNGIGGFGWYRLWVGGIFEWRRAHQRQRAACGVALGKLSNFTIWGYTVGDAAAVADSVLSNHVRLVRVRSCCDGCGGW